MERTPHLQAMHLIRRLHDIAGDPAIHQVRGKVTEIPTTYEGLRSELKEYLIVGGNPGISRFGPFERAGFQPFWAGGALMIHTPKGAIRVC